LITRRGLRPQVNDGLRTAGDNPEVLPNTIPVGRLEHIRPNAMAGKHLDTQRPHRADVGDFDMLGDNVGGVFMLYNMYRRQLGHFLGNK
jgi:hypothetical protein